MIDFDKYQKRIEENFDSISNVEKEVIAEIFRSLKNIDEKKISKISSIIQTYRYENKNLDIKSMCKLLGKSQMISSLKYFYENLEKSK